MNTHVLTRFIVILDSKIVFNLLLSTCLFASCQHNPDREDTVAQGEKDEGWRWEKVWAVSTVTISNTLPRATILFRLSPFCIRNYEFILIIRAESTDRPPTFLPIAEELLISHYFLFVAKDARHHCSLVPGWQTVNKTKFVIEKKDRKLLNMSFLHTYNALSIQGHCPHRESPGLK